MRKKFLFLLLTLALVPSVRPAGETGSAGKKTPWSLAEVLKMKTTRKKVVVEGTVKKAFNLNSFLLNDGTAELAVTFDNVRQTIKNADAITVYGRFLGPYEFNAKFGRIEAIKWAPKGTPEANALMSAYGLTVETAPPIAVAASNPPDNKETPAAVKEDVVETRLKTLQQLLEKKLITHEEYEEQRKRILNSL